jgi:hypothetical protein
MPTNRCETEHPDALRRILQPHANDSRWNHDLMRTGVSLVGSRGRTRSVDQVALQPQVEGYPEFAREAFHFVIHGAAPGAIRLDGGQVFEV